MEGIPYLVVMVIALQTDISGTKFLCALQQLAVILSQKRWNKLCFNSSFITGAYYYQPVTTAGMTFKTEQCWYTVYSELNGGRRFPDGKTTLIS